MRFSIILILSFYFSYSHAQFFFEDVALDAGIVHDVDHREFLGGGGVFFDFDNDGDEDLYLSSGWGKDHFYVNQGDGTFQNLANESGFRDTQLSYTNGAIAGDIDNDGFKDLFVNTRRSASSVFSKNLLFHNNGDGTFTEIWDQPQSIDSSNTMGSVFIDYDLDGLLDIYTVAYVEQIRFETDSNGIPNIFAHDCFENKFYHNLGNGKFEEISEELGLQNNGCALAITSSDYDGDGDMDLYLANDFGAFIKPNALFENQDGNFIDVSTEKNADVGIFGMGIAVGDFDFDLDLDYYVTNLGRNVLLENTPTGFVDATTESGVENTWVQQDVFRATGWGTGFLDFDNDLDLDLVVSNGIIPADQFISNALADPNKLYVNNGDGTFNDQSIQSNTDDKFVGRGIIYSDYDNDGDLDLVNIVLRAFIDGESGNTRLFENKIGNSKNWLQVDLEGVKVNRDAIGSKLFAYVDDKVLMREISGGSSHGSQNSTIAHFGLNESAKVDSLEIVWTGGENRQWLYDLDANQRLKIKEDTSAVSTATYELLPDNLIKIFPNPNESFFNVDVSKLDWINIELDIFDVMGNRVFKAPSNFDFGQNVRVDSRLNSGIYILEISNKKNKKIRKLLSIY